LGLKLKSAQESTVVESPKEVGTLKREITDRPEDVLPSKKVKKTRLPASAMNPITPNLVRKKSVTFTPETKVDDGDSIKQLFNSWAAEQQSRDPSFDLKTPSQVFSTPEPARVEEDIDPTLPEKERRVKRVKVLKEVNQPKNTRTATISKPTKAFKVIKQPKPSSRPFLSYLRQYHKDRPSWKFNKNHQNHLIKHIFNFEVIPSDHAHLIYEYVRGLQGGVRTRLRDAALAIKVKDQEEGAAGFAESMIDREKKQQEYNIACNEYVATMTALDASSKMGYEEGVLLGLSDYAMKERMAKRTRAEQILAELGQEGGSEITEPDGVNKDSDSQKRLRMNDGSSQKVARKRKQRTTVEDIDTSLSEDSSDSDSTSNTPEPEAHRVNYNPDDTSSSSSSSSSSSDSEEEEDDDSEEDSEEDSEDTDSE